MKMFIAFSNDSLKKIKKDEEYNLCDFAIKQKNSFILPVFTLNEIIVSISNIKEDISYCEIDISLPEKYKRVYPYSLFISGCTIKDFEKFKLLKVLSHEDILEKIKLDVNKKLNSEVIQYNYSLTNLDINKLNLKIVPMFFSNQILTIDILKKHFLNRNKHFMKKCLYFLLKNNSLTEELLSYIIESRPIFFKRFFKEYEVFYPENLSMDFIDKYSEYIQFYKLTKYNVDIINTPEFLEKYIKNLFDFNYIDWNTVIQYLYNNKDNEKIIKILCSFIGYDYDEKQSTQEIYEKILILLLQKNYNEEAEYKRIEF